jgi:hypothetical protein
MREILVATKKKGEVSGSCWSKKKHSCPQYDNFMWIWGDIGELSEMFNLDEMPTRVVLVV